MNGLHDEDGILIDRSFTWLSEDDALSSEIDWELLALHVLCLVHNSECRSLRMTFWVETMMTVHHCFKQLKSLWVLKDFCLHLKIEALK